MAKVPDPPSPNDATEITSTSFFLKFTKGASNGSAQTDFNFRYADNLNMSNAKKYAIFPAGARVTGLRSSTQYFVQVQARNAIGWSDWSRVLLVTTYATPTVGQPLAVDPVPTQTPSTPPAVPDPPAVVPPTIYVPAAPDPFYIDAQGATGFHYSFHVPGNMGGGTLQELQVGYGTDPDNVQYTTSVGAYGGNGDSYINNLSRNTVYYVWSRARNESGWGPWSIRYDVRTRAYVPAAPSPLGIDSVTQVSVRYSFKGEDDGGAAVEEWQVGYGTDANGVQTTVSSNGVTSVSGLNPYTTYYFWSRGRNAEGWGNWSVRTEVRTQAGGLILENGAYKAAIPYVKIDGAWTVALPLTKRVGLWKGPF